jgi:hypothetical protein
VVRVVSRYLPCLLLLGATADAAQGLAETAAREKERRAKQQADKPARSYSGEDLANAKGSGYTQMDGPAVATPASTAGPETAATSGPSAATRPPASSSASPEEAHWRNRARETRARVARLEAEVQDLDKRATASAFGSETVGSCASERIRTKEDERRQEDCMKRMQNEPLRQQEARGKLLDRLARARQELAEAKSALASLDDDARRAGAHPGWLRE